MSAAIGWAFVMDGDDSEMPAIEDCSSSPQEAEAHARAFAASLRRQDKPVGQMHLVRVRQETTYLRVSEIKEQLG